MRSLYVTLEKNFMRISWLSRFPRFPAFLSLPASFSVPHLTTMTVGVRRPATAENYTVREWEKLLIAGAHYNALHKP